MIYIVCVSLAIIIYIQYVYYNLIIKIYLIENIYVVSLSLDDYLLYYSFIT